MKSSILYLSILCFISALCINCSRQDTYLQYIQRVCKDHVPNFENDYDSIFILPRIGCQSCKVQSDLIIKQRLDNTRNLYILTNLESKKLLKIEYGTNLQRENIIIDNENNFYNPHYEESAYPVLLVKQKDGTLSFDYLLDVF